MILMCYSNTLILAAYCSVNSTVSRLVDPQKWWTGNFTHLHDLFEGRLATIWSILQWRLWHKGILSLSSLILLLQFFELIYLDGFSWVSPLSLRLYHRHCWWIYRIMHHILSISGRYEVCRVTLLMTLSTLISLTEDTVLWMKCIFTLCIHMIHSCLL